AFFPCHQAPTAGVSPLSLHDALPILQAHIVASAPGVGGSVTGVAQGLASDVQLTVDSSDTVRLDSLRSAQADVTVGSGRLDITQDRKSTRLNSSHVKISYAVFCLKKK